jgi:hypothetical protein
MAALGRWVVVRTSALGLTLLLLVGACSASGDVVVSEEVGAPTTEITRPVVTTTTVEPSVAELAGDPESESEPGTAPDVDVATLLLTTDDLPGWDFSGPMSFSEEPTFDADDCDLMNTAWSAHGAPGTRVRAEDNDVTIRQTVVEMANGVTAATVLDAADAVWNQCTLLNYNGGEAWTEPVELPQTDGWRVSGLALGSADGSVWIIGYWQRGSTVMFVDINGVAVWDVAPKLFSAIAGRLIGEPRPVPMATTPGLEPPVIIPPSTTIPPVEPPTTTTTLPDDSFPRQSDEWPEHELAHLAPTPDEIGDDWIYDEGIANEAVAANPEDAIEGCDAPPPPTLAGFELTYRLSCDTGTDIVGDEISVLVGGPDAVGAQAMVESFRAVADCDLGDVRFADGLEILPETVTGADDSVILRGLVDDFITLDVYFGLAVFDGVSVGVIWTVTRIDDSATAPAMPDDPVDLMELIASKR